MGQVVSSGHWAAGITPQVFRHVVPSIVSHTARCGLEEGVWGTSTCSAGLVQNFLETLVYVCVVSRQFVGHSRLHECIYDCFSFYHLSLYTEWHYFRSWVRAQPTQKTVAHLTKCDSVHTWRGTSVHLCKALRGKWPMQSSVLRLSQVSGRGDSEELDWFWVPDLLLPNLASSSVTWWVVRLLMLFSECRPCPLCWQQFILIEIGLNLDYFLQEVIKSAF